MRRRGFLAAVLLLAAGAAAGCSAEKPKADLVYLVSATDGGVATDRNVQQVETEMDTRLLAAGYERRHVTVFQKDKIRISLPEAVAGKIPEIRKLLEGGDYWKEIKVTVSLVSGGGQ